MNTQNTQNKSGYIETTSQTSTSLGERLQLALGSMSQRELARAWGGSSATINTYVNDKKYPRIHDLEQFAKITDTDFVWLITGQYYSQANWLAQNQSVEICPDNSMTPTINIQSPVVIETVDTSQSIHNGIYCIESSQGRIFRRLQWDEDKQGFWLRCDNRHFEPQFTQTPSIVGRVVSALAPVI